MRHACTAGAAAGPEQLQAGLVAAFFVPGTAAPDLSLRTLSVLLGLGADGAAHSIGQLAEALELEPVQLRRAIAALERGGLAQRLAGGARGRGALVAATPAGARLIDALAGRGAHCTERS